jgi:hypothetical protein
MTTVTSQKVQKGPLLAIFASEARIAVLRVFMLDPLRAYYQRQIEAATHLPIRAVQRELERLTAIALLYRREEGNRTYYQVDTQFSLFPELRSIILKMASPEERLRGNLALDESVRLVFHCESDGRVLIVTSGGKRPSLATPGPFSATVMSVEEFTRILTDPAKPLDGYLSDGVDLLGRRDDVIWRRIEAAGYEVRKGKGVP